MRWVAVVLVLLVLLAGCAMLAPFTQQDFQQIEKVLEPYVAQWGDYVCLQIHVHADHQGWIRFFWFDDGAEQILHGVMLTYFDGKWIIVQEK